MADTELATAPTGTSSIKSLDGEARAWVERILPLLGVRQTPNTTTTGLASPNILQTSTQSVSATLTGQPGFPKVPTIDDLVKAIEVGDEPAVRQAVPAFAKMFLLDQRASNGETPLTQAIKATHQKNFMFAELLVLNGASPDARNKADETPLFIAAELNDDLILNFLLIKQAKVDEQVGDKTALFIAIEKNSTKVRDRLLTNNPLPNVDLPATGDRTPLMEAASHGDLDSVTKLQQAKADLDLKDSRKRSALMYASEKGYPKVVKFLLEKHANPHNQDDSGHTALMDAADSGSPDVGKSLLTGDRKVFVGVQDDKGRTALMHAVQLKGDKDPKKAEQEKKAKLEFVKVLLNDPDTDLSLVDNDQSTVLRLAARSGDANMVRAILQSPRAKGKTNIDEVVAGKTVLLEAAVDGRPPDVILAVLEAKPKNLDEKDPSGSTALMYSIRNVNAKAVKILVDRGAQVGQADLDLAKGALQFASSDTEEKALKTEIIPLLEKQLKKAPKGNQTSPGPAGGVPSTAPTPQQQQTPVAAPQPATILMEAVLKGDLALIKTLVADTKFDLNVHDKAGDTALTLAASQGSLDITKALLGSNTIRVEEVNGKKESALIIAAGAAKFDIVDALLAKSKDPKHLNLQDQDGNTALIASVEAWSLIKGDVRIVKALLDAKADRTKRNTSGWDAENIANNRKSQSSDAATQKDMDAVLKLLKP